LRCVKSPYKRLWQWFSTSKCQSALCSEPLRLDFEQLASFSVMGFLRSGF
jgi:hypothetical protein